MRPSPLGQHQPDPVADRQPVDAGPDRVDQPGAVLAGSDLVELQRVLPALPVSGVDPGPDQPDPHLARAGLGQVAVDQGQDGRRTGLGEDDGAHAGASAYRAEAIPAQARSQLIRVPWESWL